MSSVLEAKEKELRELLAREPFCIHPEKTQMELFIAAFTHDSFTEEYNKKALKKIQSYERLEFLGDAVLGYIVCDEAYRIGKLSSEGEMTNNFKQKAVSNKEIVRYLRRAGIDFGEHILLGRSFSSPNGDTVNDDMRSDVFEALTAAIYLTEGMDRAREVVRKVILNPLIESENLV